MPVMRPLLARKSVRFGLVGFSGILVNQIAIVMGAEIAGLHYLLAAVIATQISTSTNFLATEHWVFGGSSARVSSPLRRYLWFLGASNALLVLRVPMLWLLTDAAGLHYAVSNAITLVALFALRFAVSDGFIWQADAAPSARAAGGRDVTDIRPGKHAPFAYNVAGIVGVVSDFELRELARFGVSELAKPDLRIMHASVGSWPQTAIRFTQTGERLEYTEHLGAIGANFSVTMGTPIEIRANGLLGRSPHVLYTNVVEALLRFILVSRGHVLLHAACLAHDGRAVLLSAQTDTGKTSTLIRLVRERGYEFMADDMVVLAADGRAISYPKPMTLSYHTLYSIAGVRLSQRERVALAVRSRVHSKSGRGVGQALGRLSVPIMSINSVVQMIVPPPKYHIDSLFECRSRLEAPISKVFLMERGSPVEERLTREAALPMLIDNTDDAYGFPPFATFAPRIRLGDADYQALRTREAEIIESALSGADVWRLRVPGHEWAETLPRLIEPAGAKDPGPFGQVVPVDVGTPVGTPVGIPVGIPVGTTVGS